MTVPSRMTKAQRKEYEHRLAWAERCGLDAEAYEALARLNNVLHKWAEDECNGVIQRDDDNVPYRYSTDGWGGYTKRVCVIADREAAAIRRATEIAERFGGRFYHQSDPRGCQVYFWRPEDLLQRSGDPEADIRAWYSSVGLACFF